MQFILWALMHFRMSQNIRRCVYRFIAPFIDTINPPTPSYTALPYNCILNHIAPGMFSIVEDIVVAVDIPKLKISLWR